MEIITACSNMLPRAISYPGALFYLFSPPPAPSSAKGFNNLRVFSQKTFCTGGGGKAFFLERGAYWRADAYQRRKSYRKTAEDQTVMYYICSEFSSKLFNERQIQFVFLKLKPTISCGK